MTLLLYLAEEEGSVKRGECEEGGIVSGGTGLAGLIGFF